MENQYTNKDLDAARVAETDHRGFVGGMWDEIGQLQFEYMRSKGLSPEARFIDVACGSLRGGRLFIPYLNAHKAPDFTPRSLKFPKSSSALRKSIWTELLPLCARTLIITRARI